MIKRQPLVVAIFIWLLLTWFSHSFAENKKQYDISHLYKPDQNRLDAQYYVNHGDRVLSKYDHCPTALESFNKAIEIDPNLSAAYVGRARCEDFDDALTDLNKAIRLDPRNAEAYFVRGQRYIYDAPVQDISRAITDYTKSIEIDPDKPAYYLKRGEAHFRDDKHLAIKDYSRAIEVYPKHGNNVLCYEKRAFAYFSIGDYDKAWADIHVIQQKRRFPFKAPWLDELRKASGREN